MGHKRKGGYPDLSTAEVPDMGVDPGWDNDADDPWKDARRLRREFLRDKYRDRNDYFSKESWDDEYLD